MRRFLAALDHESEDDREPVVSSDVNQNEGWLRRLPLEILQLADLILYCERSLLDSVRIPGMLLQTFES